MKSTNRPYLKLAAACAMLSVGSVMMSDDAVPTRVMRVPRVIQDCKRQPRQAFICNDISRKALEVDQAHAGVAAGGEVIPFTGKGVVMGIIDSGIDPRHPAFSDPTTGNSRIALYITTKSMTEAKNGKFSYNAFSPIEGEEVQQRFIDFSASGHGTHTSGTAAGAYCGVPYYGIAPDATFVMTCMGEDIYDDEIAFGITSALDYARTNDMPCVASLSIGSCTGLHDGTGMTTELLAEELDDSGQIVCFAAGNDGANKSSIYHDFTADHTPLATVLHRGAYGSPAPGVSTVFVSSSPDMQIAFSLVEIGPDTFREVWRSPYINRADIGEQEFDALACCPDIAAHLSENSNLKLLTAEGISGVHALELQGALEWQKENSTYTLGVIINLPGGGEVRGFTEFTLSGFGSFGIDGYTNGDPSQSISDYCTSPYVISVGAVNERVSYVDINGKEHKLDPEYCPLHATAYYTSYGTIPYKLPHTTAPGTYVISALNDRSTEYPKVCEITDSKGTVWHFGASSGTSMSTPALAGVIALWLQADPDLNREEILQLLEYSANPDYGTDRAQFGVPSAYKGLKHILESQSSVLMPGCMPEQGGNTPHQLMVKYLDTEHIEAVVPFPTEGGTYTLCSSDGRTLCRGSFTGSTLTLSLPSADGICILNVTTPQGSAVQKLALTR